MHGVMVVDETVIVGTHQALSFSETAVVVADPSAEATVEEVRLRVVCFSVVRFYRDGVAEICHCLVKTTMGSHRSLLKITEKGVVLLNLLHATLPSDDIHPSLCLCVITGNTRCFPDNRNIKWLLVATPKTQ